MFLYFTGKFNLIFLLLTSVWCCIYKHCRKWGVWDCPTLVFYTEELLFRILLSLHGNATCRIFSLACLPKVSLSGLDCTTQSSVKGSVGARQDSPEAWVALLVLHLSVLGEYSLSWLVGGSPALICHCVFILPKLTSAHTEQNFIPRV